MARDTLLTYAEAAKYCGVARQAVYQCLASAGIEPVVAQRTPGKPGMRNVRYVKKSVIDALRKHGYLHPRPKAAPTV